ncbi:response regulator [Deltaproteobacteria bacterium OttesenSCG-928-M10]|nr:response regulator [Deltaproteobacteria bacterium OttesenSCG-928-M10]
MARTVLFVDKDTMFVERMRQMLHSAGYRIICAQSRQEARRIIGVSRPDIVITEVMLEHQDGGFCLAWELKKKYPDVPVVMVSAVTWHTGLYFSLASTGERNWIKADAFLDKPIRYEELMAVVQRLLHPLKAA